MTRSCILRPVWLCVALAWVSTTAAVTAHAQEPPFVGVVTENAADLYAGAGDNYYVVRQVAKGTLLTVDERVFNWYKVVPPEGTFSYISKDFVKVGADGTTGVVTGQRVRVRAPSPKGPEQSYRTQHLLNDGDKLQIVGESGAYFKIVPPTEARLFVLKEFVRPATPDEIAAAKAAPVKPVTPVTPDKPVAPVTPDKPVTPVTPVTPDKPVTPVPPVTPDKPAPADAVTVTVQPDGSVEIFGQTYASGDVAAALKTLGEEGKAVVVKAGPDVPAEKAEPIVEAAKAAPIESLTLAVANVKAPVAPPDTPVKPVTPVTPDTPVKPSVPQISAALAELELRYEDMAKMNVVDQPIAALRMDYEKLLGGELSERDRTLAKARLESLATRQELQDSLKEVASVKEQLAAAKRRDDAAEASRPREYTAVGRLVASTLYTGDKLPLLHRIVDPLTGLTIAYVRPGDESRIANLLGQYVGVVGRKEYDPALKLHIIDASAIDTLTPQGS